MQTLPVSGVSLPLFLILSLFNDVTTFTIVVIPCMLSSYSIILPTTAHI